MKFKKKILKDGLRLITVPMIDNPSVTVLVMVEAGSKYETEKTNGISHFLEHMVFKGTPKRPKAIDISKELDSIGANYNAFTSQEFTGYYAKANSKHFDIVLDVVSDMYLNPIFDENEIKKEKGVIVEEIRMYRDLPQRSVFDVFFSLLYGEQPAGWNIAGTEETVNSFTRKDFVDYRKHHYVGKATTVVIAGSFNEKEVLNKVKKAFAGISTGPKSGKQKVVEKQTSPAIKTLFKETDQTHIVIGVRTFPIGDKRIPAILVLATILGKGMSSRLFSKMRDDLGICYYIKTDHDPYTDHGNLAISAGLDNSRIEEGIKGILIECSRLKTELVSEIELKKAKDHIAGTMMLDLETSDSRAEFYGYQETLKKTVDMPKDIISRVQKVTAADVKKLANEIFVNNKLNMAIVGKTKDTSDISKYFKF